MPKVYSQAVISQSKKEDPSQSLIIYYCICGHYAMVIDVPLERLARRKTDNAYIVPHKNRVIKLNTGPGPVCIVKRGEEYEKQYRFLCSNPECQLLLGYDQKGDYTYLLDQALFLHP